MCPGLQHKEAYRASSPSGGKSRGSGTPVAGNQTSSSTSSLPQSSLSSLSIALHWYHHHHGLHHHYHPENHRQSLPIFSPSGTSSMSTCPFTAGCRLRVEGFWDMVRILHERQKSVMAGRRGIQVEEGEKKIQWSRTGRKRSGSGRR